MTSPRITAHHDQLDASVRDRYDRNGVNIHDQIAHRAILHTVSILCDVAMAFDDLPLEQKAPRVLVGIGQALESIIRTLEAT